MASHTRPGAGPAGRGPGRRLALLALQALLTLALVSFVAPTAWMVLSSLKAPTEVFGQPARWLPERPQWGNYARVFTLLPLAQFMANSVAVVLWAVAGTLVSSVSVAYAFARLRWPGRSFWFALLLATMLLPDVITLVPRFVLFRSLGWLDSFLPLTVPYWTATSALYVFLLRQFFRGLPAELEDAARIDGAGRLRVLCQIIVPLAQPAIATVAVFATLQHYNDFLNPLIFVSSMEKWTLAVGLRAYNDAYLGNWELVFAASTIMAAPMVALFVLAQRSFVQGIATTGFGGR